MKSEHIEIASDGSNTFSRIRNLVEAGVTVRRPFARTHSRKISRWKTWFYRITWACSVLAYITIIYLFITWLTRLF